MVLIATVGLGHQARANNFFDTGDCLDEADGAISNVCLADNSDHFVFYTLGPKLTSAVDSVLYGSYDTTRINIFKDPAHTATTDVFYGVDNTLPSQVLGRTHCVYDAAGSRCDHFHVMFHTDTINAVGYDTDDLALRSLACHESGHTVGLTHPDYAGGSNTDATYRCMRTPLVATDPLIGAHNAGHLNTAAIYP